MIILDFALNTAHTNGITTDTSEWEPEEKEIIYKALKPYWEQLPEYADLEEKLFSDD